MKTKLFTFFTFLLMANVSWSAMMTNHIEGVGPNQKIKPLICIQDSNENITYALAPGQSVDANQYSGNPYYVGATIRFGGCTREHTYLGYVGFSLNANGNNAIQQYSSPKGVPIFLDNGKINSRGEVTGRIRYKAIANNPKLVATPLKEGAWWPYAGINLSGLEFSKVIDPVVVPNLSEQDSMGAFSDLADTQAFLNAGMNTVRVPLRWAYLQLDGPGKGDISRDYYDNYVRPLLQTLTQAKAHTIVDLHAYMRYAQFGEQHAGCGFSSQCPDGKLVLDEKAYVDVWTKLLHLMQNDPAIDMNYILVDIVNEPVEVPDQKVFTIQASVIKALRAENFKGPILVEGNSWSGLHSWENYHWTARDGQVQYSNATLFTRENFEAVGIHDLSNIYINVHQYLDHDFSGTSDSCQADLTTQGPNGFNLNAFVDYLQRNQLKAFVTEFGVGRNASSCSPALRQFMQYLQDNSAKDKPYGFVGWTIWSSGHGWGDYNLRVKPNSFAMNVLSDFL